MQYRGFYPSVGPQNENIKKLKKIHGPFQKIKQLWNIRIMMVPIEADAPRAIPKS